MNTPTESVRARWPRRLVRLAGVLIILVGVLSLAAWLYLRSERFNRFVADKIEQGAGNYGLRVSVGGVKVNWVSRGARLRDLQVYNQQNGQLIANIKEVELSTTIPHLFELSLRRDVILQQIRLTGADLRVTIDETGQSNFAGIHQPPKKSDRIKIDSSQLVTTLADSRVVYSDDKHHLAATLEALQAQLSPNAGAQAQFKTELSSTNGSFSFNERTTPLNALKLNGLLDANSLQVEGLQLDSGFGELRASGSFEEWKALRYKLDVQTRNELAETLRIFAPEVDLKGALNAQGHVEGSFGTPVHWKNDGVDEIVVAANSRLKGFDLRTGKERWLVENVTGYVCTSAFVADGMLFFGGFSNDTADSPLPTWDEFYKKYDKNGDGIVSFDEIDEARIDYWRGVDANRDGKFSKEDWDIMSAEAKAVRSENVMLAVKPGGTGNIGDTHVAWRYRKALPYVPTPIYYEGRIYFVRDGGIISSLDAKTGEPRYAQERLPAAPGSYYASPVAANGRLYVASVAGKLTVIQAGGEKPEVLHQAEFGERILATPALAGDAIYVRTDKRLWAFGK